MRHCLIALVLAAASLHADVISAGDISPVNVFEGSPFSGLLATINDDNVNEPASDLSGTINWGDGTTSALTIAAEGGGNFSVSGTHTYAEAGVYTLGLFVKDGRGDSGATGGGVADVGDVPLFLSSFPPSITFTPGTALSNIVLLSFGDENPFGVASDYSGQINWGDNTNSAGTIASVGGGIFNVIGSHTYTAPGQFTIGLSVLDQGGSTLTAQESAAGIVPEPGSFGLICAGLALGCARLRRR